MLRNLISGARPLSHGTSLESMSSLSFLEKYGTNIALAILSTSVTAYALFQLKLLPKSVARVVSKIFFYPTLPITALMRYGNYWTPVDETVRNFFFQLDKHCSFYDSSTGNSRMRTHSNAGAR